MKDNEKDYYVYGLKASASGQDAGEYITSISKYDDVKVFDEQGVDVTERFDVRTIEGKLNINPKDVILRSASLQKEYDGAVLTNNDIGRDGVIILDEEGKEITKNQLSNNLLIEDGWVSGQGATYQFKNSVLYPNETIKNEFEYSLNADTKASNYNIKTEYGNLTITNRNAKYKVTLLT